MTMFYQLTDSEKKIRKYWLIWLFISTISWVIINLSTIWTSDKSFQSKWAETGSNFIYLLFQYALYYCAYKNPGTRFLTVETVLYSILIPIAFIANIFLIFKKQQNVLSTESLINLISIIVLITCCYLNIKLKKVNLKIQQENMRSFAEAYTLLKTTSNINDLDALYKQIEEKFSDFKPVLADEYQNRKMHIQTLN